MSRYLADIDRLRGCAVTASLLTNQATFGRREIDPAAANHVAISFTMMRDELRGLRVGLWHLRGSRG